MPDLPVACTLSPAALKARREGLLINLVGRAEQRLEVAGGCRLRFAASDDILAAIARTVDAERQCCRFLRFTVTVEPDGGSDPGRFLDRPTWNPRVPRRDARRPAVITNVLIFVTAAFLEITGCFAFWSWLRARNVATHRARWCRRSHRVRRRSDAGQSAFAGRAYAAYGRDLHRRVLGVAVAGGRPERPSATDLLGAVIAVAGALVIIGMAPKAP